MAHQTNDRGSTRNDVHDTEVHGSVVQADELNGHIVLGGEVHGPVVRDGIGIAYFIRNGSRRADVLVGAVLLLAAVVAVAPLVQGRGNDEGASGDDSRSVPGKPLADANAKAWGCGESAVVPKLKVGPDGRNSFDQFPSGGILASGSSITITLQGTNDEELILTGARAEIVARHRPAQGTHVAAACGSDAPARDFTVDLDRDAPPLEIAPDTSAESTSRELTNWSYAVKVGDAEHFVVIPQSTEYDTEFRILIPWSSGRRSGTLVVDDGGKPFRVTATTAAAPTCFGGKHNADPYRIMPGASSACHLGD